MDHKKTDNKFCVNCVHHHIDSRVSPLHFCHHPDYISYNRIDGNVIASSCKEMRLLGGECGPKGLLFEPIPQEPQKKWWEFWK